MSGTTPARRQRDAERGDALRAASRAENEGKQTIFASGCEAGDPLACASLGEWHALMRQDYATAARYYTKACLQGKVAQACLNLGMLLAEGRGGVPHSAPRAISVLSLGCQLNNADACAEAARLCLHAASTHLKLSQAESDEVASMPSTTTTGGDAGATGWRASVATAERMLNMGCFGHAEGDTHGGLDADGLPRMRSSASAKCCGMLGGMYTTPRFELPSPLPRQVPELLATACLAEHAPSCMRLGKLFRSGAPDMGITPSIDEALRYERLGLSWSGLSERRIAQLQASPKAVSPAVTASGSSASRTPVAG